MKIEYDAYWKNDRGNTTITHGELTDEDLQDAVLRKEQENASCEIREGFVNATFKKVEL